MRRLPASSLAACAVTLLLGAGCGASETLPEAKPMPGGAKFTGVWYSQQFEHMFLRQTGDAVNGIYSYKYGGTLEGEINGNMLKFIWIDPGNKEAARRDVRGRGYLQLMPAGDNVKLVGQWGYDERFTGGGPWTAEFVREIEPEDPRNLKELSAKNNAL